MTTYPTSQIADFMLAKSSPELGDFISNLKLQKLIYYAAGVMAALRQDVNDPLFTDPIEAWTHGPVVPAQYHRFSQFGSGPIPNVEGFDFDSFNPVDLQVLDDVYSLYGQYSAWKLRNMTHEEAPWLSSYDQPDNTISLRQLIDFFVEEIDETYIAEYQEKSRQQ